MRRLTALFALGLVGCVTVVDAESEPTPEPVYIEPFTIICDPAPEGEVPTCREAWLV